MLQTINSVYLYSRLNPLYPAGSDGTHSCSQHSRGWAKVILSSRLGYVVRTHLNKNKTVFLFLGLCLFQLFWVRIIDVVNKNLEGHWVVSKADDLGCGLSPLFQMFQMAPAAVGEVLNALLRKRQGKGDNWISFFLSRLREGTFGGDPGCWENLMRHERWSSIGMLIQCGHQSWI